MDIPWKDQYKHPLWQKKRLEALEFHGYQCEDCEDKESQLHVHHRRYIKGRAIWDYEMENFSVLCEGCHEFFHQNKEKLNAVISVIPPSRMQALVGLVAGWAADFVPRDLAIESYCQDFWSSDLGDVARIWGGDFDIETIEAFKSLNPDEAKKIAEQIRVMKNGSR